MRTEEIRDYLLRLRDATVPIVQRLQLAEQLRPEMEEEARLRMMSGVSQENGRKVSYEIAELVGVSPRTVERYRRITKCQIPGLLAAVNCGKIKIPAAVNLICAAKENAAAR